MLRTLVAPCLLSLPLVGSAQPDSTVALRIALLGGAEAVNAGGFEALAVDVGLPQPSATVLRTGLGLYCTGAEHIHFGAELLFGNGRSSTDSASARTFFFSMELQLGYALARSARYEISPTLGFRLNEYAFQADRYRYDGPFPQVTYRRASLSPGVFVRYGGRLSGILRAGALIPLGDGRWQNDRNGQEIADGPPVRFQGYACLGIGYALQ